MNLEETIESILEKIFLLKTRGVLIALSGDLGTGKTTVTQKIGKKLGIEEKITSPTFVIQKTYSTKNGFHKIFTHIDLYRIEKKEEQQKIDFIKPKKDNIIIIEWFEYMKKSYPTPNLWIECKINKDEEHMFSYK